MISVFSVMSIESIAFPNRAYLVLDTFVFRPDRDLNLSRISRISRSWACGSQNLRNMLMSSAYASTSFWWFWADVHGVIFLEWDSFSSSNSMHIMKRYPAIGSPCLHPLPTFISGGGEAIY